MKIGDKVTWTSSNTPKRGEVIAIVPAGKTPADVGFPKAGGGGIQRDHESYILKGRKHYSHTGQPYGSKSVYWPHVSLIEVLLGGVA